MASSFFAQKHNNHNRFGGWKTIVVHIYSAAGPNKVAPQLKNNETGRRNAAGARFAFCPEDQIRRIFFCRPFSPLPFPFTRPLTHKRGRLSRTRIARRYVLCRKRRRKRKVGGGGPVFARAVKRPATGPGRGRQSTLGASIHRRANALKRRK